MIYTEKITQRCGHDNIDCLLMAFKLSYDSWIHMTFCSCLDFSVLSCFLLLLGAFMFLCSQQPFLTSQSTLITPTSTIIRSIVFIFKLMLFCLHHPLFVFPAICTEQHQLGI